MAGWHHQLDRHEFGQALGVGDGQGSLACYSPWARKESVTNERLNNRNNNPFLLKGSPGGSEVRNPPAMQGMQVRSLGWKDHLE